MTTPPRDPDRRRALAALGITTTLLPFAAAAATGGDEEALTVPGQPTSLSITLAAGPDADSRYQYDGSWSAPVDDGGAAIELYEHGIWNGGGMVTSGTQLSTATSYLEDLSIFSSGFTRFRVRAKNAVGWGEYAEAPVPVPE